MIQTYQSARCPQCTLIQMIAPTCKVCGTPLPASGLRSATYSPVRRHGWFFVPASKRIARACGWLFTLLFFAALLGSIVLHVDHLFSPMLPSHPTATLPPPPDAVLLLK